MNDFFDNHLTHMLFGLSITGIVIVLLVLFTTWIRLSYDNNQQMIKQAQKVCNNHLLFFTEEYGTNHPIIVCAQPK